MAKKNKHEWELKSVYDAAVKRLKELEKLYAEETDPEKKAGLKEVLTEQRAHVIGLAKIKNDRDKNRILEEANTADNRRTAVETIAVIPIVVGTVKAAKPILAKLLKFIPK